MKNLNEEAAPATPGYATQGSVNGQGDVIPPTPTQQGSGDRFDNSSDEEDKKKKKSKKKEEEPLVDVEAKILTFDEFSKRLKNKIK